MNKLSFALLLTATAATSGACVSDSGAGTEPDVSNISADLDKTNGGFATTDEAVAFGDEALFADADLEATTDLTDAMATDPTVRDMQDRPDASVRGVVMLWGQLPADPTHTTPTEWSGRITASRGAVVGVRQIGFEDRTDAVLPRDSRTGLAFLSLTTTHADGLAMRVIDPTPGAAEPFTLTYNRRTGEQYVIDVAALAAGPQIIDVDGENKLIAVSVQHRADCDAGAMRGRWRKVAPNLGHFLGLVVDRDGGEIGHVRGIFGERAGERRLFGKLIDADGTFKGLMVGTYEADGTFAARWITRAGETGRVRGLYRDGDGLRARHGAFLARWAETACSEDRPLPPRN